MELARGAPPYAHFTAMQVLVKTMREEPPTFDSYPVRTRCCGALQWGFVMHTCVLVCGAQETSGPKPKYSSAFVSFVRDCLVKNPKDRSVLRVAFAALVSSFHLLGHVFLAGKRRQSF
jgi:hypothetical protein